MMERKKEKRSKICIMQLSNISKYHYYDNKMLHSIHELASICFSMKLGFIYFSEVNRFVLNVIYAEKIREIFFHGTLFKSFTNIEFAQKGSKLQVLVTIVRDIIL